MGMVARLLLILITTLAFTGCKKEERKQPPATQAEEDQIVINLPTDYDIEYNLKTDPKNADKGERINGIVRSLHRSGQFHGCVLVAEKGRIIYKGCYGNRQFHPEKEATLNTAYHLASVSKHFTAMGILMLHEEGLLDIHDTASAYLPGFPYEGVTIRHLLSHTSGVPELTNYVPQFLQYWDTCRIARNRDIPEILREQAPPPRYLPGRRFSYSNTGYILLGSILEKVSGMEYEEFVETYIFDALDMNDSFVYNILDETENTNMAIGYAKNRGYYYQDNDDIRNGLLGEKGIYASAIDMYKWDRALSEQILISDSLQQEAFEFQTTDEGERIKYGFGWRKTTNYENLVYHYGLWRGFRAGFIRVLDDDNTIVILNNTSTNRLKYLTIKIMDVLYSDWRKSPPRI